MLGSFPGVHVREGMGIGMLQKHPLSVGGPARKATLV